MIPQKALDETTLLEQRALWRRQGATFPALHGGKRAWVGLVLELVDQVDAGAATAMEARPDLSADVFGHKTSIGAPATTAPLTWGEYGRFLKSAGLAQIGDGMLTLTSAGAEFKRSRSVKDLGVALASRFRLLAESLQLIAQTPITINELDTRLRSSYKLDWTGLNGTRARTDWLDALGAIEPIESRRWQATKLGEQILADSTIVSPQALTLTAPDSVQISAAPPMIANALAALAGDGEAHTSRSTYNIWVPSPKSQPNKVENLRTIVNAATERIDRSELLQFIASTFSLQRSSVDSMLPFLRASGLISEVGFGVFQSTPAAHAWIESDDNINFVRILHTNMRFVGEMLSAAQHEISRPDLYKEAEKFGLNVDKSRWIAAFLQDTDLLEQPRYGSLRTTALGRDLLKELPLANPAAIEETSPPAHEHAPTSPLSTPKTHAETLDELSRAPHALGQASGQAFEHAIRDVFLAMGFDAKSISGSGDTDVTVRWHDDSGNEIVAIVEAKSRASGSVAHTDVSDVAIETHKTHHKASHVAVIAPGFTGDTIKNMAVKRNWTLLDARRLGEIADEVVELGLRPAVTGALFEGASGLKQVDNAIERRRRELAVLSLVIAQLADEASQTGEAITPRDISRDGRRSELKPTIDEVLAALSTLRIIAPEVVQVREENEDSRFSSYLLGHARSAASELRALADAIEAPLLSDG